MEKQKIGFYALYETGVDDSYVGSLLITDENGIPLEFKCTHAVKPTPIQKSLYGNKLRSHIAITLCGVPLLNNVNNKPNVLFVNINYILGIRADNSIPTFLINAAGEAIDVQADGDDNVRIRLEDLENQYSPIIIQPHPYFKDESNTHMSLIQELLNNFDLMEPFDRMKKSVEILGKNDSKFK